MSACGSLLGTRTAPPAGHERGAALLLRQPGRLNDDALAHRDPAALRPAVTNGLPLTECAIRWTARTTPHAHLQLAQRDARSVALVTHSKTPEMLASCRCSLGSILAGCVGVVALHVTSYICGLPGHFVPGRSERCGTRRYSSSTTTWRS